MLTTDQIDQLGQKIGQKLKPDRIILFGSHANGDATEDSDIDLMVVTETSLPPAKRYGTVRRLLDDYPASFDIVVKTPEEYARCKNVVNHIVYFAEREGRVIYERCSPEIH